MFSPCFRHTNYFFEKSKVRKEYKITKSTIQLPANNRIFKKAGAGLCLSLARLSQAQLVFASLSLVKLGLASLVICFDAFRL